MTAAMVQLAILRRLSGSARLRLAAEMSGAARALALAGLGSRHPDWSADRVRQEWVRMAIDTRAGTVGRP